MGFRFFFFFSICFPENKTRCKKLRRCQEHSSDPPNVQVFTRRRGHDSEPFISLPGGRTVAGGPGPSRTKLAAHWGQARWETRSRVPLSLPHCLSHCPFVILPGTLTSGSPGSWKISTHVFLTVWMTGYDQLCLLLSFWAKNWSIWGSSSVSYGSLQQSSALCQGWGSSWLGTHPGCQP